jgi:hypothetical protein
MKEAQMIEINRKAEAKAFGKGKSVEGTIFSRSTSKNPFHG